MSTTLPFRRARKAYRASLIAQYAYRHRAAKSGAQMQLAAYLINANVLGQMLRTVARERPRWKPGNIRQTLAYLGKTRALAQQGRRFARACSHA